MKTQATSLDVARLAGVSQSAVSRCFTAGASVSEAMRNKVQEAARKLGYQPNAHARSLITGRSRIIGLVLSHIENLFYPAVLEQLAQRLQQDGYHLLIFISDGHNADDLVGEILQYKVDGIVLGATTLSSALAQRCADASIPVVLFNRIMAAGSAGSVSSVRSDNVGGGREIARFLVAGGHRRIAYLAGREDSSTNLERERGFREGLAEAGQRIYARAIGNYDVLQARQATRDLFAQAEQRPDAVFVASDQMAIAVLDTLRHELGLAVPQQVSVVGFDNVPQAAWESYALTTFEQPVQPMVEATVELLQSYLRGDDMPNTRNIVIAGQLVLRGSCQNRHEECAT
ncbi:MAG: LacI family DNA-binding transcriptional regulator [Rhodoferax sp.]|nr:LacI family DNA-binding transcriptional regulator [Rhodoferax sp.]